MALTLAEESWTWYGFVIMVVCFRFTSRINHAGSLKGLAVEDFIMIFVVAFYTVLVVYMNIVAGVDTNLIDPADVPTLTPEQIQSRIYGSKMVLLVEQCMITTQWGCKICLLLMYNKLTFGLKQHYAVKVVGVYVVVTWIVMDICYFGVWCQPFNQYWAVPPDSIQCSAAIHHLIMNAVFNITSDMMMLFIPLPLLISSKLPKVKKAVLCILFGMGIFVILCAALNKYYSFNDPFSPIWTFWYIREASVAILIANIPNCWPLLRRLFRLKSFNGSSDPQQISSGVNLASRTATSAHSGVRSAAKSLVRGRMNGGSRDERDPESGIQWSKRDKDILARPESQKGLQNSDMSQNESERSRSAEPWEIWTKHEVSVNKEAESEGERAQAIMYGGVLGAAEESQFRTKTVVTAQDMQDRGHGHSHGHGHHAR